MMVPHRLMNHVALMIRHDHHRLSIKNGSHSPDDFCCLFIRWFIVRGPVLDDDTYLKVDRCLLAIKYLIHPPMF